MKAAKRSFSSGPILHWNLPWGRSKPCSAIASGLPCSLSGLSSAVMMESQPGFHPELGESKSARTASRIVYMLTQVTSSHEGGGPPVPSPCEHVLLHLAADINGEWRRNGSEGAEPEVNL